MKESYGFTKNRNMLIIFFLIGFFIYFPSLKGNFIFDDVNLLNDAQRFQSVPGYFKTITTSKRFFTNRDSYAFWVLFLTEYKVFGMHPSGYKIVNLLFHILASFVFFLFLKRLLTVKFANDKNKGKEWISYFSFLGGLLFLAHPLDTDVVSFFACMNKGIGRLFFVFFGSFFVFFAKFL